MPTFRIVHTRDWQIPWQIWSDVLNENRDFHWAKPDYYIAGFKDEESAKRHLARIGSDKPPTGL